MVTILDLVLILGSFALHEFGHYIMARCFGYKTTIGISRRGLYSNYRQDVPSLPRQLIITGMGGIGIIPLLLGLNDFMLFPLFLMIGYSIFEIIMRIKCYRRDIKKMDR